MSEDAPHRKRVSPSGPAADEAEGCLLTGRVVFLATPLSSSRTGAVKNALGGGKVEIHPLSQTL